MGSSRRPIGRAAGLGRLGRDHIGTVEGAFTGGQERLPLDTLQVMNPTLLALGIAASGLALLDHRALGLFEPLVDLSEFCMIFDLDT